MSVGAFGDGNVGDGKRRAIVVGTPWTGAVIGDRAGAGSVEERGVGGVAQINGERFKAFVSAIIGDGDGDGLGRFTRGESERTGSGRKVRAAGGGTRGGGVIDSDRETAGGVEGDGERGGTGGFVDGHVIDAQSGSGIIVGDRAGGGDVGGGQKGAGNVDGGEGERFGVFVESVVSDGGADKEGGLPGGDGDITGNRLPGGTVEVFEGAAGVGADQSGPIGEGKAEDNGLHAGVAEDERKHGVSVGAFGDGNVGDGKRWAIGIIGDGRRDGRRVETDRFAGGASRSGKDDFEILVSLKGCIICCPQGN